jgi:large subunit ribosomal protein L23
MKEISIKPNTSLIRPRITEKAAIAAEKDNIYTFEVTKDATHKSVIASVKAAFGVTPVKVRLLAIPRKQVFVRGKKGFKTGGKKAYVYLKKGDKIEIL